MTTPSKTRRPRRSCRRRRNVRRLQHGASRWVGRPSSHLSAAGGRTGSPGFSEDIPALSRLGRHRHVGGDRDGRRSFPGSSRTIRAGDGRASAVQEHGGGEIRPDLPVTGERFRGCPRTACHRQARAWTVEDNLAVPPGGASSGSSSRAMRWHRSSISRGNRSQSSSSTKASRTRRRLFGASRTPRKIRRARLPSASGRRPRGR